MKTYEIKYRVGGRSCCGRRGSAHIIKIQASTPEAARQKVQKLFPGSKVETIFEVKE